MTRRIVTTWLLTLLLVASVASSANASTGLFAWGENAHLELAAGYRSIDESSAVPTRGLPTDVQEIAAGEGSDAVLTSTGDVWTWGGNAYGQACIGAPSKPLIGARLVETGVRQISAGGADLVMLMDDGTVKVCGGNLGGEAGNGTTTDGKEIAGMSIPSPQTVPGLSGVVKITGGGSIAATLANGNVMVWGNNARGELGIGTHSTSVTHPTLLPGVSHPLQVLAVPQFGFFGHMLVLTASGEVLAAGDNRNGGLGDGTTTSRYTLRPVVGLPPIAEVAVSAQANLARSPEGQLYAWGADVSGQLGAPAPQVCPTGKPCSTQPLAVPLAGVERVAAGNIGSSFAVAGGRLYAWGDDEKGMLGDGAIISRSTPKALPGITGVSMLAAGSRHTLAVADESPQPPVWLSASTAGSSLTVTWAATRVTPWKVVWVEDAAKARRLGVAALPAGSTSYTIPGLAAGRYEVYVSSTAWPHPRVAVVTVGSVTARHHRRRVPVFTG